MSDTAVARKKALGIISFKGLLDSIDKALDGIDTKRAEKRYEKIRGALIESGTRYSEEEYSKYAELAEKAKNLTPNERIHLLESVMKGKDKEAGKNRRNAFLGIGAGLVETGVEMATGQSVVGALLAVFGVTAPPATTIVAATLAGGTALFSLYKLHKSKNFVDAEKILSNEEFMNNFSQMVDEVKKLCDELDKTKEQDIQSLKSRQEKGKKVSAKDFKRTFAMNAYKIIHNMQLKHISKETVIDAYGIKAEAEAFEKAEAEKQEAETERQQTEATEIEARVAEETRMAEEMERKKEEDLQNAQRGQE